MKKRQNQFLEQIIEKNKYKIYRICKIYAVSPIEPQDLFQEVIFQIWKSLDNFKEKSSIDTWIYKITVNVCLRFNLKLTKNEIVNLESIHFTQIEQTIDNKEKDNLNFLYECICTLNATDKSIIALYLDDLAYKEIAEITGLSENHIAVKMKRIRKKLHECITPKIN